MRTHLIGENFDVAPLLMCMNMQKEHITPGRRHIMTGVDDVVNACAHILAHWRNNLWPIVHLKRVARSAWFNPASDLTEWIPAARPQAGELVFEHPLPSAYSSRRFASYRREVGYGKTFVVGFSLEDAVLATVIDGFHQGHNMSVVFDAIACKQPKGCDLVVYRQIVLGLIANYATLQGLEDTSRSAISLQWGGP